MNDITKKIREIAKDLLTSGEVHTVIGWEKGREWYQSTPVLVTKPEDVENLVWDEFCHNNLSKYLMDYKHVDGKVAIFVKGCDSRAFNRLLQDLQVEREKAVLIGIPCSGLKDDKVAEQQGQGAQLPLAKRCTTCKYPNPIVYDQLAADLLPEKDFVADYSDVEAIENMSADEKYKFWNEQHEKCLRCYACRNVCPACNCRECIFDQTKSGWTSKANNASENQFYAMTRAMHVAGRCIECGECERVCPVNIPIMLLNRKLVKDINLLFGEYDAGIDPNGNTPLGHFKLDDPEEFM